MFYSVQLLSHVRLFATPWIAAHQALLSITTPGVHSNLRPSSRWCHTAISSSVVSFSSSPQSLPASGSFPMNQFFTWGAQSIGVSALSSFLPQKSQGWSPSEWTGWISLQSKGLSRVFSNTTVQKHQFFSIQPSSQSKGSLLSPYLFNFYAEYIMWNAGLDEAQAGIKIAGRNINHLRYAGDTALMAESE